MINPSDSEIAKVCDSLKLESDYLRAALDEEESSRIEVDDGVTLIIVDIPIYNNNVNPVNYSTIPLGIILSGDSIVTVCLKESPIIRDFIENRVKTFYTFKKTRFILQILYRNATRYLQYLKQIDKESSRIESELHKSMKNKELIQLLALEKSLVYFSTSLKANELVLEKLMRLESIKNYPEDADLLEDVIVENKQAIEMAKIYSDILSGTMDAFASVISNNLNIVMKFLASITIVMAIPTMISSFFGMNVAVPMTNNPFAFAYILGGTLLACTVAALAMARRKMF
jgi:magnesium transporter